jgi:hypothetical protein
MEARYFLHYVNEVDFAQIAEHDLPLLEGYAAGVDLSREGKFGPAAQALWGEKAGLPRVYEWMREWEQVATEEGMRQTLQALLAPGAEGRLPVPFRLKLFEEEAIAHRYFWETYEIFVLPVAVPLIVLRAVPVEGFETTPAGARVAALLKELLKGGLSLTTAYTAFVDTFRDTQADLRRVTAAIAEGAPLAEPVVAQAQTTLWLAVAHALLTTAYYLLARETTYTELGTDYYDHRQAERVRRRAIQTLELQGYRVSLEPAA